MPPNNGTDGNTLVIRLPLGMTEDQYWLVQHGSLHISIVFSAVLAVVAWDFILLIPDEIRLYRTKGIWNKVAPWAFVVLRYAILLSSVSALFFTVIPTSRCELVSIITWVGANLVTIAGGMIFCIRVLSLWNYSKSIAAIVGTMYTIMVGCWIYVAVQTKVANGPPMELFSNCQQIGIPSTSSLSYASSVAFDLVIVVLTLMQIPRSSPVTSSNRPVAAIMYHDTLLYFIANTLVNITVCVVESLTVGNSLKLKLLKPIFIPFSSTCTAILASRVFLNLRRAVAAGDSNTGNHSFISRAIDMSIHTPTFSSRDPNTRKEGIRRVEEIITDHRLSSQEESLEAASEPSYGQWKVPTAI